uniref:U3 small nucleolar RNA-associated protein 14 n=1 Tax=Meloidogyne floridensis TaxID=298350 RepID=A0A915NTC5_9BILA
MKEKIEFNDLLVNIKSTRNVNEVKRRLEREERHVENQKQRWEEKKEIRRLPFEDNDEALELEIAVEEQKRYPLNKRVLDAPLHRQALQRIEGKLAYRQTKNELREWQPIVDELRVAEQIHFPQDEFLDNPLKVQSAEERAKTFTPRTEFEQKIMEVLGKSKSNIKNDEEFSQAEKEILKAMDVREVFNYLKFHRIQKRQKRKDLIKEVETLIVKDPKKAAEKVDELEKDRAFERATLKHRGTNKWTKQIRKFASRNPELRKVIGEQLRLGKSLKERHGAEENDSDDESGGEEEIVENTEQINQQKIVSAAVDKVFVSNNSSKEVINLNVDSENPFYRSALQNIKRERKIAEKRKQQKGIEEMKEEKSLKIQEESKKEGEIGNKEEKPEFLDLNVKKIIQIPQELMNETGEIEDAQYAFLAEAYEEDDVLGNEFMTRKQRVEEEEKPKQGNSRYELMRGWGSWTGPGISEENETERMDRILGKELIPKKKKQQRKDARKRGLIIREQVSESIQKLQPRDVPFPFTRIQDFEAFVQQPLGKEWNTPIAHNQLIQPTAGRIIKPLDKKLKEERKDFLEDINE